MTMPPDTFAASDLQAILPGDRVQSGQASVTHTGNGLHEVHVQTPNATLTLSLLKGGTIVSAHLLGMELFDGDADYHDLTRVTRTKGNPNIFPVFNQMPEGTRLPQATQPLPNHGIARNEPWQAYILPALPGVLVLQLQSNTQTRAFYPHDFTYTQFITLDQQSLTIGQHIVTDGPFAVGFHPYFRVSNKRDLEITGIPVRTAYWYLPNALSKADKDAVIAQDRSLFYAPGKQGSINFAAGEVNHHFDLSSAAPEPVCLDDPGLQRRIRIERAHGYLGLTVWCNADEERSVCIEPVTDRSGMLSTKPCPWRGWVRYSVESLH